MSVKANPHETKPRNFNDTDLGQVASPASNQDAGDLSPGAMPEVAEGDRGGRSGVNLEQDTLVKGKPGTASDSP